MPDPVTQTPAVLSGETMARPAAALVPAASAGLRELAIPRITGVLAQARRKRLSLRSMLFVVCAVLPTLASAIYYLGFASEQFVSESRFGIRAAEMQRNDATAMFQGMASASQIGLESNVVVQFAQSREIVDALEGSIGLRRLYSSPSVDWVSRLDPESSAEDVVTYWRGKIDPFFDLTTGSISLRVKAFTRADAQRVNAEVLRLSENLVNELSAKARSDTVRNSQEEVSKAEARLQKARDAILEFRNKERQIDPKKQADSLLALTAKLREELAKATAELSIAKSYLSDSAPTVIQSRNRIRSLQEQIDATAQLLTSSGGDGGGSTLSRTVGSFNTLESEQLFAEKYHNAALESLQKAQAAADRQSLYFSVFVRPALPDRSTYPRRAESVFLTLLAGLGIWIIVMIAVYSIREHV